MRLEALWERRELREDVLETSPLYRSVDGGKGSGGLWSPRSYLLRSAFLGLFESLLSTLSKVFKRFLGVFNRQLATV
jgi:hypothetical protein